MRVRGAITRQGDKCTLDGAVLPSLGAVKTKGQPHCLIRRVTVLCPRFQSQMPELCLLTKSQLYPLSLALGKCLHLSEPQFPRLKKELIPYHSLVRRKC